MSREPRSYVSSFAPLDPEGPLPPGLESTVARNALSSVGGGLRRSLEKRGRSAGRTRAARLRGALDDPSVRAKLAEEGEPFHNLLYTHLKRFAGPVAHGVWKRTIEPAEVERGDKTFLDPALLRLQIDSELSPAEHIEPHSESSVLASFCLAFGLLQPEDAHEIIGALLLKGPGFRTWFGAVEASEELVQRERARASEAPPAAGEAITEVPPTSKSMPSDEPGQDLVAPPELTEPRGPRRARLEAAELAHAAAREERRRLGAADTLEADALRQAIASETRYMDALSTEWNRISTDVDGLTRDLQNIARDAGVRWVAETLTDPRRAAEWVDVARPALSELQDGVEEARRLESELRRSVPVSEEVVCTTLDALRNAVQRRLSAVREALSEQEASSEAIEELRTLLQDCSNPRPNPVCLKEVDRGSIVRLLQHSRIDSKLQPMASLLIRWLGEHHGWTGDLAKRLETVMDDAARAGEPDLHAEALAFVPPPQLQELLLKGSEVLRRHVILATFRESVARNDPAFINLVWSRRDAASLDIVGTLLSRLFDGLATAMQHGELLDALTVAASRLEESTNGAPSRRDTAANELADWLEATPGMVGNHFRLRKYVWIRHFRPLAVPVRCRDVGTVAQELARLQQLRKERRLEADAIDDLPAGSTVDAKHKDNLDKYIETVLVRVQAWLAAETAHSSRKDDLFDASQRELGQAVEQLVTDHTHDCGAAVGTVAWLECEIAAILSALRGGERPEWSAALFADLPSLDQLVGVFHRDDGRSDAAARNVGPRLNAAWPYSDGGLWGALTHGGNGLRPSQERLWACHLDTSYRWQDVLHDAIAQLFLGRSRAPEEVVRSLMSAGLLEAADAALDLDGYCSPETRTALIEELERHKRQRSAIERQVTRVDAALGEAIDDGTKQQLETIQTELLEVYVEAPLPDFELVERRIEALRDRIDEHERMLDAMRSARKELERWLRAAGIGELQTLSMQELEARKEEVLRSHASRRVHIECLARLARPNASVHRGLRAAAAALAVRFDHPEQWPTQKETAEAVSYYLELLEGYSARWGDLAALTGPHDPAPRKIHRIVDLLAARLDDDIRSMLEGRDEDSCALRLLGEPDAVVPAELERLMVQARLLPEPSQEIVVDRTIPPAIADVAITTLVRLLPEDSSDGTGADVNEAFVSFGESRWAECIEASRAGAMFCNTPEERDRYEALLGIHAVSRARAGDSSPEIVNALPMAWGVILRHGELVSRRSRLELEQLVADSLRWLGGRPLTDLPSALDLAERGDLDPDQREHLLEVIRSSGGQGATALWAAMTGETEQAKGRTALLLLLFELDQQEGLSALLRLSAEAERYLRAYVTLVARAQADPSHKLHSAIRQSQASLRTRIKRSAPLRSFVDRLAQKVEFERAKLRVEVQPELERVSGDEDAWSMTVRIVPEESDPPLALTLTLVDCDFDAVGPGQLRIADNEVLLSAVEKEMRVRPRDSNAAVRIAVEARGETASGRRIQETYRANVVVERGPGFSRIPAETLIEAYPGYRGDPVTGTAFVGREHELEQLRIAFGTGRPGALVLYGMRRVGKTSLLTEFQERNCVSRHPERSSTLIIRVSVDTLTLQENRHLGDRLMRTIREAVVHGVDENPGILAAVRAAGHGEEELTRAGMMEGLEEASFFIRLRTYARRLLGLLEQRARSVVFVFDEFDKLLEAYRAGRENEVHEIANQLRKVATETPDIGVILAGSDFMRKILDTYRSAFYGSASVIELGPFETDHEARQVVAPGALEGKRTFAPEILDEIFELTGRHPHYLRLVGLACCHVSRRRRISRGTVYQAVRDLMANRVLPGLLTDVANEVREPLKALALMSTRLDEILARALLHQLARHTTLERKTSSWARVIDDAELLSVSSKARWGQIRDELRTAKIVKVDERGLWGWRHPILGEALRQRDELAVCLDQARALADEMKA